MARGPVGLQRREQALIYVAATAPIAAGLRAAERPLLDPGVSPRDKAFHTRELGLRLGYPTCCAAAFAELTREAGARGGPRSHPDHGHALAARVARPDWRLNCYLLAQRLRLLSFAACRLDCARAIEQADLLCRELERHAAGALAVLRDMLARPLAIGQGGGRAWVRVEAGRIVAAEAPREPPEGPVAPQDAAAALAWPGAEVGADDPCVLEFARASGPPSY